MSPLFEGGARTVEEMRAGLRRFSNLHDLVTGHPSQNSKLRNAERGQVRHLPAPDQRQARLAG